MNHQATPLASLRACTPQRMAKAGVPLEAALEFHTRVRNRGPRNRSEHAVFKCVRTMVARVP